MRQVTGTPTEAWAGGEELANLVEEFAARAQAGEAVDPEAFARAHPAYAEQLRRLLPAVRALAAMGRDGGPLGRLGDFRLLGELGRGGMGIVYEAEQVSLGRRVALKVLPMAAALDGKQLQRFKNEAQAAALLQHPHIVPVIAVGQDQGTHYFAMQLIDGQSLAAVVAGLRGRLGRVDPTVAANEPTGKPGSGTAEEELDDLEVVPDPDPAPRAASEDIPVSKAPKPGGRRVNPLATAEPTRDQAYFREVARLLIQAAEALDHAHQVGVVHRDVKPANLLLDGRGELWVTDFGLARLSNDTGLTASGDLLGTIRYMSPEQALARRMPVDHRTDVYGLGVTAYELLTLEPAFPGKDRQDVLRRIAVEEPPRPRHLNRDIPDDLEAVVLKAMEKSPGDRYATARELADDLRAFLDEKPVKARRPSRWRNAVKWARRHTELVITAAAAAAAVLFVLTVTATLLGIRTGQLQATNTELKREQHRTEEALDLARQNAARAQKNADRAKKNGKLVLAALQDVVGNLVDERVVRDRDWTNKAADLLTRASKLYDDLARDPGEEREVRQTVAWGLCNVGQLYAFLGKADQARKAYGRGIELSERMAVEDPKDFQCRLTAAMSYRLLGDLDRKLGERDKAVDCYRRSVQTWQRPTPGPQCPIECPRSLASIADLLAHAGMADFQERTGNRPEAVAHYKQAIGLRSQVGDLLRQQPDLCYELASWHRKLGDLLQEGGDAAGAAENFRQACELGEDLVRRNKAQKPFREELALSSYSLAGLREEDQPREAEKGYGRARELFAGLSGGMPGVPGYRRMLAEVCVRLGTLARVEGRGAESRRLYRQARDLYTGLVAEVPGGGPGPGVPGENEDGFAWFLANCPDTSFRDPARAVELARKATRRAPARGDYWRTFGAACYRAGNLKEAAAALEKAEAIDPDGDGQGWLLLAMARQKLGQTKEARACFDHGVAWADKHKEGGHGLRLLRSEAAALLGLPDPGAARGA
jgi:serine/threonine protein kinase